MRFSVAAVDMEAAVAWVAERGFAPCRIEHHDDEAVLIFPSLPDEQMAALVMAMPVHLSSKVGIVVGDRPPFAPRS